MDAAMIHDYVNEAFAYAAADRAHSTAGSAQTSEKPRADQSTQDEKTDKLKSISVDTYTPSVAREMPGDIEQALRSDNCYCGSCESCRTSASQENIADSKSEHAEKTENKQKDGEDTASHELSEEEERQVQEMQQTDQKVRSHEQAHVAAGANSPTYEYQTGPDGRQYAVGGSAQIDIAVSGDDPESKATQARRMRSAALAPADPSGTDLQVAAKATRIEMEAMNELREKQQGNQAVGEPATAQTNAPHPIETEAANAPVEQQAAPEIEPFSAELKTA